MFKLDRYICVSTRQRELNLPIQMEHTQPEWEFLGMLYCEKDGIKSTLHGFILNIYKIVWNNEK